MERPEPLDAAHSLVADAFPDAHAAFLGGSVLTTRRTTTSDLDIVVVMDGSPAPYRETLMHEGWVVELFVQTPTSLRHYWAKDASDRDTPLARMCAEGVVLVSVDGVAERYAAEARAIIDAGPQPLPADMLRLKRYLLTDLLDDLRGCTDDVERAYIASSLVSAASDLVLLVENRWTGSGKWLPRLLAEVDPALPIRLVEAQRAALNGDRSILERVVLEVLDRAGGPLTAGLRMCGEDPDAEGEA